MRRGEAGHSPCMSRICHTPAGAVSAAAMTSLALLGAAAIALASLAGAADGSTTRAATLRLADTQPLTVIGARFLSRESVVVRATVDGERSVRRVRATPTGRFTAIFAGIDVVDRCSSGILVRAVGARGSEATLKLPQPLCPPPLRP